MNLLAILLVPGLAFSQTVLGPARFTVIAPELIRLEYQKDGHFIDDPSLFAVERGVRFDGFREDRSGRELIIDTGRIRLIYIPDGKPFHPGNLRAIVAGSNSEWTPGAYSRRDLGGARNLDNTKGPAPMEQGLLSRDGWHVIDDSKTPLWKRSWIAARPDDAGSDWYLFGYGSDYKAALKALTTVGGRVPMPRRYALGSWYSRWWPHSAADYQRIVKEYADHDFPLDVLVMDMDWHTMLEDKWTGYTWNRKLFPDPSGFLKWVHAQGLFATLNDHLEGGVQPGDERYENFMKDLDGDPAEKKTLPFDAGDQHQMKTLFEDVYASLEADGVDFWWLDYWSDDAKKPFNRLNWVNDLYYRRSQRDGKRGLVFSRWDGWGGHKQPVQFSGDTHALWSTLKFQVPFTANAGNMGAFFWAHDIGGYQGARNGELTARWTQFGAFSAALRLHSMNKPWLDKRPWSYPKAIEDSMRVSFHLRSELFPYTYSSVWQAHDDSLPLLRPLYLEYPDDERAYRNPQEYLYGDAFLVAPIVSPGAGPRLVASQKVWLPEGTWYDWFSGRRFEGPLEKRFSADVSSFPVFARGGVPIPMRTYTPRMGTEPVSTLIVRAYPGEEAKTGSFILYEDDGLTMAYSTGAYAYTKLQYLSQRGAVSIWIEPSTTSYGGEPERRSYIVELPGLGRPAKVEIDDKPAAADYDEALRGPRVAVPERGARERAVVRVWTVVE